MRANAKAALGRRALLAAAIAVCLGALGGRAGAQPARPDLISARSQSGQFMVYARRSPRPPPSVAMLATNQDFVQLEPILATVSCERIKEFLARELGPTEPWRGHIYATLYPARGAGENITIASEKFADGWQYQVSLPDVVERSRYVGCIVQVLLLEYANRTAAGRAAEIPLWLTEGFTQLLLASSEVEIILPPPRDRANGLSFSTTRITVRKENLVEQAQKKLRGRPPLTFESLSWPGEDELSGNMELYRGSAQLFVGELLRLPDGRGCLQAMLTQLPHNYNWQFAFLKAFHAYFERPLDVEKWWSLSLVQAAGRDLIQPWTPEESWQKLDAALHSAVQVRTSADELPLHTEVKLQAVIREWETVRQNQVINGTLRELTLLRLRIAQSFMGLVLDYSQALETYLQQRDHTGSILPFTRKAARRRAADEAIQQLDALDALRAAMRPVVRPAATNQPPARLSPGP